MIWEGEKMIHLNGRNRSLGAGIALVSFAVALGSLSPLASAVGAEIANVDEARVAAGASNGREWLSAGLGYDGSRFSPLNQISTANVNKLGLAWSYPLE